MATRNWRDYIPDEVKNFCKENKFGGRLGFGRNPVLLVIDMQVGSLGERGDSLEVSVKKNPHSAGQIGWEALDLIRELLAEARMRGVPIIYTKMVKPSPAVKPFRTKFPASRERNTPPRNLEIVDEISPTENDIVIEKEAYSAFFGTPLLSYLHQLQADTLLITGRITGSCVRSTALDAAQHNFYTILVEECVFDRTPITHAFNMFELDTRFADVLPLNEVMEYLKGFKRATVATN